MAAAIQNAITQKSRATVRILLAGLILWLGLAVMLCGPAQAALSIDNVRVGVHPDKTRLVFDLSNSTDFRVFTLPSPWRLVVDFPESSWRAGGLPRATGSGVKDLRQGRLGNGISRIVFDLDRPVAVRAAFLLPHGGGKPDRLVVDFASISAGAFAATKDRILGTLSTPALETEPENIRPASGAGVASALAVPVAPIPESRPKARDSGKEKPWEKPLVVIDPGHGGVDPGAIGANRLFEKNVTLALGKALRDRLLATGRYRVKMTRDSDVYLHLGERVAFARHNKADLFVSLHADSIGKTDVRGASIYTLSEKASDAQSAKLAERENQSDLIAGIDMRAEDKEVASILVDLAMRETMNQSRFFANTVVTRLDSQGIRTLENPHRFAGFAVLKAPDIPSVLIENGFMSNPGDARLLSQDGYRRQVADAIVSGIDAYFETVQHYDTP